MFYWSEKVIVLISDYRRLKRKERMNNLRKSSVSSQSSSSSVITSSSPGNKDSVLFIQEEADCHGPDKSLHLDKSLDTEVRSTVYPHFSSRLEKVTEKKVEDTETMSSLSIKGSEHEGHTKVIPVIRAKGDDRDTEVNTSKRLNEEKTLTWKVSSRDITLMTTTTNPLKSLHFPAAAASSSSTDNRHHHHEIQDLDDNFDDTAMFFKDRIRKNNKNSLAENDVKEDEVSGSREDINETLERKNNLVWMVIIGDAIHNLIDGLSLGAALADSHLTGFSIAVAILFEEIPHELGDLSILLSSGMTRSRAAMFNFASASSCYLGMMIGIISGDMSSNLSNSYIFAVAAGMFLYISLFNIMTDMNENFKVCRSTGSVWTAIEMLFWQNLGVILGIYFLFSLAKFDESMLLSSFKIEL